MTTLSQLKDQIETLIDTHGPDYQVASFLIGELEIQDYHQDMEALAMEVEGYDPSEQPKPEPLTPEEVGLVVRELESSGTAMAKLMGVPICRALEVALHGVPRDPAA